MKIANVALKALELLLVTIMAILTGVVFYNVILRYLFNSGSIITEELSRYLFVWLVFIGAILTFYENAHVRVTSLIEKIRGKKALGLGLFTHSLMLICCYLILVGCWQQAILNKDNLSPIMQIPSGIMPLAGVAGSLGIGIIIVCRMIMQIRKLLSRG